MKKFQKTHIIVLCLLLMFSAFAPLLPIGTETAEAKSSWTYGMYTQYGEFSTSVSKLSDCIGALVIAKNNKEVSLADFLVRYRYNGKTEDFYEGIENGPVKFKSQNTDIVTVNSKTGLLTPKKTGTALITITWQNVTMRVPSR